ncbi:MAG: ABC transporter permease [Dehalococcoidia bacterium]|nr:ABC transporter permease [Dehalococcoidia bacterium]
MNARRSPWARVEGLLLPIAGLVVTTLLWWAGVELLQEEKPLLARFAPRPTFDALVDLLQSGEIWPDVRASLRRVVIALALATAIGIPLGVGIGSLRRFRSAATPTFQFIRMVSPLAWTPLAIIVLGVGDSPVLFLLVIGGVWPIMLNTASGVQSIDPRWISVARSLGANRTEVFRTITWPAIKPHVLTGIRLAVGVAWIILVPAEMLGVDSGLGYAILDARDRLAYSEMMAVVLIIGFVGMLIDTVARALLSDRPPLFRLLQRRARGPERMRPASVRQAELAASDLDQPRHLS